MKLGKANPIRSPRTEKFPTSGVACTREHEEDPPEQEPPKPCTQVTATQIPAKSQNSITATTYFEFVEVPPRQSEQRRQQCNSSPATSRTFENDAEQPLTANRSGGFSSRETNRTQPALKATNPARPRARGRPQRGGEADKTPAPADWQPTPNRCKRPWGIDPGLCS